MLFLLKQRSVQQRALPVGIHYTQQLLISCTEGEVFCFSNFFLVPMLSVMVSYVLC